MPDDKFVMGLWDAPEWSDAAVVRWREKTLIDIENGIGLAKKLNAVFYAIGPQSARLLSARGVAFNELAPEPMNNMWAPKLRILEAALDRFHSIVWLDSDCVLQSPIPDSFWGDLHARGWAQMKLRQFGQPRCGWRSIDRRKLIHGGAMYFRNREVIQLAKRWQSESGHDDEVALSWAIDQMYGGWQGVEHWWEHHELPWLRVRKQIKPATPEIFSCT